MKNQEKSLNPERFQILLNGYIDTITDDWAFVEPVATIEDKKETWLFDSLFESIMPSKEELSNMWDFS